MGLCVRLIASAFSCARQRLQVNRHPRRPRALRLCNRERRESSKRITAAEAAPPLRAPSAADISFMQGMIMHHSQAVTMTDLLRVRTHNKALLELGKRISISQTDEMKYMRQWLEDRGAGASRCR